jgi:hypothetical protein
MGFYDGGCAVRGRRRSLTRGRRLIGASALSLSLIALTLVAVTPLAQAADPQHSQAIKPPKMSNCPAGMSSNDDANVRVWACKDGSDDVDESIALVALEGLYGPMTTFMGHAPLPDIGGKAGGGDTRIDIYLMNSNQALTREGSVDSLGTNLGLMIPDNEKGTASSGYILIQRSLLSTPTRFTSVMAHEFFHVLEAVYNDSDSCPNYWFTEAAATWAEWYFVPSDAATDVYPWFAKFQANPGQSLFNPGSRNSYSEFIWAMYMQQQHGAASVASAWKAASGASGCAALNSAVDGQVSFAANFKHFAVENFDSMLPNLQSGVKEWPVCPTCQHYQDLTPLSGTAPPFPQTQPVTSYQLIVPGASYPWKSTVSGVNLPQLSAEYDEFVVQGGTSVEFDFSGLSNPSDLDVSLIAADYDPGNGSYLVVPVTGTDQKVCLAADNAAIGDFYVVLDNHDAGAPAQITGSYTVTARATCALSLAGTLNVDSSSSAGGIKTTTKDTLRVKLKNSAEGWDSFPPSTGTYKGTYKQTGPDSCPNSTYVINAKGSGAINGIDLAVSAYQQPYSTTPYVGAPVLISEQATGTKTSPCGNGTTTVILAAGYQCPVTQPQALYANLQGAYSGDEGAVAFNCSKSFHLSRTTYSTTVTGTLTASGLFQCGLWLPDFCSLPGKA